MIARHVIVLAAFGLASLAAQAHHSIAAVYDSSRQQRLEAVVAEFQFVNPHRSITVTVKNKDGTTTDWTFTTGSATALAQRGITKVGPNALKIGEEVTVTGTPAWNGAPLAGLKTLKRADGTVLGNEGGN